METSLSPRFASVFRDDAPGLLSPAPASPALAAASSASVANASSRLYRRQATTLSAYKTPPRPKSASRSRALPQTVGVLAPYDTKMFQLSALRDRIDALMAENEWLKAELQRTAEERDAAHQRGSAAADGYRADALKMDDTIVSLREQCKRQRAEIVEWKHRSKKLEGKLNDLRDANEAMRRKLDNQRLAAEFFSIDDDALATTLPTCDASPPPPPPPRSPRRSSTPQKQESPPRSVPSPERRLPVTIPPPKRIVIPKRDNAAALFLKQRKAARDPQVDKAKAARKCSGKEAAPRKTRYADMLRKARVGRTSRR